MAPTLDEMGNIKRGEDLMNIMRPEGLPMLDEMGQPLRVDFREVLLIPIMDESGKHPQMDNG
jgi:cobalamin biosynthesis Co2+ chelatase CbiK